MRLYGSRLVSANQVDEKSIINVLQRHRWSPNNVSGPTVNKPFKFGCCILRNENEKIGDDWS
jgi:hypothetical protein